MNKASDHIRVKCTVVLRWGKRVYNLIYAIKDE